jgi:DeoR family transcriptional regulator of aga operon
MVRRADRVIVTATGDKVGKRSFSRICDSSAIHVLVTDASAPTPELEALAALGVQIVIV